MEAREETKEETRARILKVSNELFNHYGFNKTTMADIARELDMSPANIYRFYEGKEDIMAEIADGVAYEINEKLREIVRKPGLSASERIEELILEKLRLMDSLCTCHTKLDEAIEFIHIKRPDIIKRHMEIKRSMLAEILSEGNRTGEFDVSDVVTASDVILHATFLCKCQWVGKCPPLEEVQESARHILGYLLNGMRRR